MNSNFVSNVCLILLGICCFISVDASIEGWSDWKCQKEGDYCFKSRTCTYTAGFNCSKPGEVYVTDCPCLAEWSSWGEWTSHKVESTYLKIRYRDCIDGINENGCSDLLANGKHYETVPCESIDTCNGIDTISEHRDGWSDWNCEKQGDFCFKSRTCNPTADFNCSKTSEVNVINCPCFAEWSSWGEWTCHEVQNTCLKIRKRTCIDGINENGCSDLLANGKHYETVPCESIGTCNDTYTISEHGDGWTDWSCEQQGDFCFLSRTCNSTADFNCSKTSEVTVTNCPCVAEWSSWGEWTCHEVQNTCLKIRYRTCVDGINENGCSDLLAYGKHYETAPCASNDTCNHDTDAISEHGGGWTDWSCQKQGDFCFKSRTCNSTADFNCPKTSEVTVINCPCVAEWSSWGQWTCHDVQNTCLKIRYRTCKDGINENGCSDLLAHGKHYETVPCESNDTCNNTDAISEHGDGWTDWSCEQIGDHCFKRRTCNSTPDFNCSTTSEVTDINCPCVAEWSPWGKWICHKDHGVCLQLRQRTCISGFKENDCLTLNGTHYEETLCDEFCNITNSTPAPQLAFSSTTSMTTTITQEPNETTVMGSVISGLHTTTTTDATIITSMVSISSSQNPISTSAATASILKPSSTQSELKTSTPSTASLSTTLNQTYILTNPATSGPFSTSKPMGALTNAYIYWLEWTEWECKNVSSSICLMSRTRNCSTYKTNDCETKLGEEHFHVEPCRKEICPVNWSEWSNWTCRIEKDGACNKIRSRKCSTGADAQCGLGSLERKPCDNVTCPELNELGQLGYCKGLDSTSCIDAETCKNPSILLMCLADAHVASKICPIACGCCHVDPKWLSWGDWRCERTKTMCRMKQSRTCSTGNTTDCEGISVREAACDESLCPEPTWDSWSVWKCQLRPNNTCTMSRSRTCSNEDFCNGVAHEEDVCSSEMCPDFVEFKVDCSLHNNQSDACVDGAGCDYFKNTPKTLCVDDAGACPVTCGCCIPSGSGFTTNNPIGGNTQNTSETGGNGSNGPGSGFTTNNPIGGTTQNTSGAGGNASNGSGSGFTTNNPIGGTTHNTSGAGGNGSNGTGSGFTTNNPISLTTQNTSGAGGNGSNGTGSGFTTNNPIGGTSQSTSGAGGNASNGTGSGLTTNNPIDWTTQNISGAGGNGSNGTVSGFTTNNPIGVSTQNTSGAGGNASYGSGSGITTNNPIGGATQNTSGAGGNGSNGTGSGFTTNNPIGGDTQNTSGAGGNGSNGTGSGLTTNNQIGGTTQNTSGAGGNASNGSGSGFTTNNPIGLTTQNTSGAGGNGSNGTGSGLTTNNPIGGTTQNTSGAGGNGSNGTGSGLTTNNPIGGTTQNTSGAGGNTSNGTGSGFTTNNPIGGATQNTSGAGGNGSNGTGTGLTTNNPIGGTTQNTSETGGNGSNGPGSGFTTNNPIGGTTQNTSGAGGNASNGSGSGFTTNNPIGMTTQNSSGSTGNVSNGTDVGVATNNPIGITIQNPTGSVGIGSNGTGSGVTTHIPTIPVVGSTQNTPAHGGNGKNGTSSTVTTNNPLSVSTQSPPVSVTNSYTHTVTPTPTKTTTTTQKQPHTPTPAAVTCNVCAGPEFLCEKLFAPQTCSPPNNYCINKLTNHIDGTRMVTRHCGNFDTCYREWFLGSSDSDKCRNFEDNNIITLDYDCTYCCTSDNCNKPIKPLDKDLYKDL